MIFYSTADCLYYITLYSCLSRKYRIRTYAFSLMPNHTHSQQEASGRKCFIAFNQDLQAQFTRGYNRQHKRSGELFQSPFGSVPKTGEKSIRSNLSYINNNGATGKLSKGVLDYRWNLMAYYDSGHPFSEKIRLREVSQRMRQAIRYVDRMRNKNKPLDHKAQKMLFKGLNGEERKQLVDYIIVKYHFLDYTCLIRCFGSVERALAGMDANTGSEYDFKEEWEDYSEYRKMIDVTSKAGFDMETVNFEKYPESSGQHIQDQEAVFRLISLLSTVTRDRKKISRFLHLKNNPGTPQLKREQVTPQLKENR